MTKRYLILFVALLSLAAWARQLTPQQALQRLNLNNARSMAGSPTPRYTLAYVGEGDGENLLYVMNIDSDAGFYVLSADDCAPALLGYCNNGSFSYSQAPDALKWWLSQYQNDIQKAIRNGLSISRASAIEHEPVLPLVQTMWGQTAPYNNDCPAYGSRKSPTGCVATAMAQIMNFHQWPVTGTNTKTYTDSESGQTITANFSSHTYAWDYMQNEYTAEAVGPAADAVTLLMKDCGVSVEMAYGSNSSGANGILVPFAMISYFSYSKAMKNNPREFYTDTEWEQMLLDELDAGRPIFYTGHTVKDEGHAFICDGYDTDGYYHFNWGWSGVGDGYYLVTGQDALRPKEQGTGGSTLSLGFTEGQCIVTNMRKTQTGDPTKTSILLGLPGGYSVEVEGTALSVDVPFMNYGTRATPNTATSKLGIGFTLVADGHVVQTVSAGALGQSVGIGMGFSHLSFDYTPPSSLSGEYEVHPVYSTTYSSGSFSNWQEYLLSPDYQYAVVRFDAGVPTVVTPGGPTAVKDIIIPAASSARCDDRIYDLNGRVVAYPDRPGIYIRNGRKIVIK
ncbi:MAG: C10 family peptidase [Bacteroidaceae bacterium]|nr:C10 family peptidase [Bacteroidaceae bacterium]